MFEKAKITTKKDNEKSGLTIFDKAKSPAKKDPKKPSKFDFSSLRTNNANLFESSVKVGSSKLF